MKVEMQVESQMQRRIDGKKSNQDREEGITLHWAVCFCKSKHGEGGQHYISGLKNHEPDIFLSDVN